jgi:hypothetical protein
MLVPLLHAERYASLLMSIAYVLTEHNYLQDALQNFARPLNRKRGRRKATVPTAQLVQKSDMHPYLHFPARGH